MSKDTHDAPVLLCIGEEDFFEIQNSLGELKTENAHLRQELDHVWMFLCEVFENRLRPSEN